MNYMSTRGQTNNHTLSDAIRTGLAPDGGLFVPETLPRVDRTNYGLHLDYPIFAQNVLQPFFSGDKLQSQLATICANAFNFKLPIKKLTDQTLVLELFHGPTLSFKDFGARFLAECLSRRESEENITIMVATSGDTGSAVASAFYRKPNIRVIILYPQGKVSPKQQQQITCWDENILPLAVAGTFDDCQNLVKTAFADPYWQNEMHLSSANSINIGRLLPQMTYYAYSSMQYYNQYQKELGFIIPTGNLGNATSAYWAKAMGFPIREIVLATNANRVIPDYLVNGQYQPRPSVMTLANAMDVGKPSNIERLQYLYPTHQAIKNNVRAFSVSDHEISTTIAEVYKKHDMLICPHTATAFFVREQLSTQPWMIVATADPCKFDTVIEPIIQKPIAIAPQLQELLNRPEHLFEVAPSLEAVTAVVTKYFSR